MKTDKALLVLDMIDLYIYGETPLVRVEKRPRLIENIQHAIAWARKRDIPVIYVNCAFWLDDPILDVIGHRPQAMEGGKDTNVIAELAPLDGELVLHKRGYDAFWKSGLEEVLADSGVRELYLTGQQTDCCVRETGVTAAQLGYKVFVLQDCCDTSRELGQSSAVRFFLTCVGKVMSVRDLQSVPR